MSDDRENAEAAVSELQVNISRMLGNPLTTYIVTNREMDEQRSPALKETGENHITICDESLRAHGL